MVTNDGTRRITATATGFEVVAVSRSRHVETAWSRGTIRVELPEGRPVTEVDVLAARPLEWSIEVLIRYGDVLELLRLSPSRVVARKTMLAEDGSRIREIERVDDMGDAFVVVEQSGRQHRIDCDPVTFDQHTATSFVSRYSADVFISYKASDTAELSKDFNESLKAAGLRTWVAPDDVFGDFRESIARGIESSQDFLIIWSRNSSVEAADRLPSGAAKMSQSVEVREIWNELRRHQEGRRVYFYMENQWAQRPSDFADADWVHFQDASSWPVDRFVAALVDDITYRRTKR